ncbi:MAG: hypothetical protein COA47_03340 [Robiginitomaculum sp.]|nr:MAG: hypothetical protein COA47_03340 [Robiginitomaculum sp.]
MRLSILQPSKNSLKVNFISIAMVFVVTTIVICTMSILAANTTSRAFREQEQLLQSYQLAIDTNGAVQELLYRSADLSNSLSAPALDAFLAAQTDLENAVKVDHKNHAQNHSNKELAFFISTTSRKIVEGSLRALDHYTANDRKNGDLVMEQVRTISRNLQRKVLTHQTEHLLVVEKIEQKTITINEMISRVATFLAIFSSILIIAMFALVYRLTIHPIQALIAALKQAQEAPDTAKEYKISTKYGGETGQALAALNSLLDSTHDALAEAQAQSKLAALSESRWVSIFNLSPDAIILIDQETAKITDCNPATQELIGLPDQDFTELSAYDFHSHEKEAFTEFLTQVKAEGHARADHLSCRLPGRTIPVSVVGVNVPGKEQSGTMLYVRDMSEIAAQQHKLELAQQEAVQANEAKGAFLATISHEIRTPLNGMMGMAQALQARELNVDDADMVETIVESGEMLMTILNDVLDISKINAKKMTLSKVPGNLHHLITQTQKLFSAQAADKGLAFETEICPDIPASLIFDPVRVRQCLNNLVSNALKFTKQGRVTIKASSLADGKGSRTLCLRVTDTGIGMDAQTMQRIFSSFTQADNSISRKFGGTGLGLSISHELALLMDGDITVRSELGQGSEFSFIFKADEQKYKRNETRNIASKNKGSSLLDCRLLLVDDSAINRKVICTLLAPAGIEIVEAENGLEALDLLEQQKFDIVLLDMHMPVLNGPETIAQIRQSGLDWSDIPVVAVTADAAIGEGGMFSKMGMDGFIPKPVDQRVLFGNIIKSLNKLENVQAEPELQTG